MAKNANCPGIASKGFLSSTQAVLATLVVVSAGLLNGCGAPPREEVDYPSPGAMEIVSVTPLAPTNVESLIPDSAFEVWYSGAPRPSSEMIIMPEKSTIIYETENPGEGNLSVRQQWAEKDNRFRPETLFGVQVPNLKPQTRYKLKFLANAVDGISSQVDVYAVDQDGQLVPSQPSVVVLNDAVGWEEYDAVIETGDLTTLRFVTSCPVDPGDQPISVLWDHWQLTDTGMRAIPPRMEAQPGGLIPNGSFEVWPVGQKLPLGKFLPPWSNTGRSTIKPEMISVFDGNRAAHQIWMESDNADDPLSLFCVELDNLSPGADYVFRCRVNTLGAYSASIAVYGMRADKTLVPLSQPLLSVVGGGGWQNPTGVFNTGEFEKVRISTMGPGESATFPNRVLWDAWTLALASNEAPADTASAVDPTDQ